MAARLDPLLCSVRYESCRVDPLTVLEKENVILPVSIFRQNDCKVGLMVSTLKYAASIAKDEATVTTGFALMSCIVLKDIVRYELPIAVARPGRALSALESLKLKGMVREGPLTLWTRFWLKQKERKLDCS